MGAEAEAVRARGELLHTDPLSDDRSPEFLTQVYEDGYDPEAPPKKKTATAATKVKAVKIENVGEIDMQAMVKAGTVNKLTVDVLKTWLKGKGVSGGTKKKGELVDLVCELVDL